MSDFLTRLAERAQGAASAVEPWIPLRYARGPDLLETDAPAPDEAERVETPAAWQRLLESASARPAPAAVPPPPVAPPGTVRFLAPPRPRQPSPAPPATEIVRQPAARTWSEP